MSTGLIEVRRVCQRRISHELIIVLPPEQHVVTEKEMDRNIWERKKDLG
jgi:hypothetical protein